MEKILNNISLKDYNTFGIDVSCKSFYQFSEADDLIRFLNNKKLKDTKHLILGGGSNLLFVNNYNGWILYPQIKNFKIFLEDPDFLYFKVGAGENWDDFVEFTVRNNLGGIENLSLIPGTVGSSPIQNIGAYGTEVKESIFSVEAIDLKNGNALSFSNEECKFGYRTSIFKEKLKGKVLITHVIFKLRKQPVFNLNYQNVREEVEKYGDINLANIRNAITQIRQLKLPEPKVFGNAGSFFKNPVVDAKTKENLLKMYPGMPSFQIPDNKYKIPAAWLIDQSGWKGKRIGDVGCYQKQPLVIINYGSATGKEVLEFAESLKKDVKKKFDVKLEPEVNIIT